MTDSELLAFKSNVNKDVIELARFGLWAQERVIPLLRKLPPGLPIPQYYDTTKKEWALVATLVTEDSAKSFKKAGITITTTIESEVARAFKDAPQPEFNE